MGEKIFHSLYGKERERFTSSSGKLTTILEEILLRLNRGEWKGRPGVEESRRGIDED